LHLTSGGYRDGERALLHRHRLVLGGRLRRAGAPGGNGRDHANDHYEPEQRADDARDSPAAARHAESLLNV
jgi:hypothetical protein